LLPAVVDPHNIRLQHFLMLQWVLLSDYYSCFLYFPKTSELDWAINAYRIHDTSYRCHCLPFRVCSSSELSSTFTTIALEGAAVVYINTHFWSLYNTLLFELHDTSMGYTHLVCTQFILHTLRKFGSYRFPSPSNGSLLILSLSLFLTTTLSVEETLMNFRYTYVPNFIHQGASAITEISSANGYKNLASSNSYEFTHGPKLPKKHFQKVQNYTTSYKIKVCYDYTGHACTCAIQKCKKSAHVHNAQLWSLKSMHT
jgi:hypothetical protein